MTYENFIDELMDRIYKSPNIVLRVNSLELRRKGWKADNEREEYFVRCVNDKLGETERDTLAEDILILRPVGTPGVDARIEVRLSMLYQTLENGNRTLEEILSDALDTVDSLPADTLNGLSDWEIQKENIYLYPMFTDQTCMPGQICMRFGMMRIGLYIILNSGEEGILHMPVDEKRLQVWEIGRDEACACALANMPSRFSPVVMQNTAVAGELEFGILSEEMLNGKTDSPVCRPQENSLFYLGTATGESGGGLSWIAGNILQKLADYTEDDLILAMIGRSSTAVHTSSSVCIEMIYEVLDDLDNICDCDRCISGELYRFARKESRMYSMARDGSEREEQCLWEDGSPVAPLGDWMRSFVNDDDIKA